MKVKFHGTRGSHPVSIAPSRIHEISENIWKLAQKNSKKRWSEAQDLISSESRAFSQIYGGHTTCIELKSDSIPMPLFLDAGTGLTAAALDAHSGLNNDLFKRGKGRAALLLTHTHWDHIMGLITAPQIFQEGNEFHFYGVHKALEKRLSILFNDEHFPVPFKSISKHFYFHQIELGSSFQFGSLKISHFAQTHPGGSFAYKIQGEGRSLVFATDTELKNTEGKNKEASSQFYSGADLLILDAHFSPEEFELKTGWGHANIFIAVDLAVREKAKKVYLFHQNPFYSDLEIDRQLERARQYLKDTYPSSKLEIYMSIEAEEVEF